MLIWEVLRRGVFGACDPLWPGPYHVMVLPRAASKSQDIFPQTHLIFGSWPVHYPPSALHQIS